MIQIFQADITTLDVDAIVNAANSGLSGGGGVDGAIHRAAGPELVLASRALAPCKVGNAVRTPGFHLHARFVIHAVGPVWQGGRQNEDARLEATYQASFDRALEAPACRTLAFPSISTGRYAFPKDRAARIALSVMRARSADFERIIACVFDSESLELYQRTLAILEVEAD